MAEHAIALRERWMEPQGEELAVRVLERLAGGESLDGLAIGQINGRADLRGYLTPSPRRLKEFKWRSLTITQLAEVSNIHEVSWRSLDLSGASLEHLRLEDMQLVDCRFDGASCVDLRMWRSTIEDSSFNGADLRNAALGPWSKNRGNVYSHVDFSRADFRGTSSLAAEYYDCDFSFARLDKLDFRSSSLIRCRFAGVLREVVFDGRMLSTGKPDPNPMEDVDLTAAELQMVQFKGIDAGRVILPNSPSLRVIDNYPCVLDKAIGMLDDCDNPFARGLRGQFSRERKVLAPGQRKGVFNFNDMVLLAKMTHQDGDHLVSFASEVINAAERACSN
jgi:uncharacterized protein YjbI with pentapeptide repeats